MKTQIVASIATLPVALAGVFFAPQSAGAATFGTSWDNNTALCNNRPDCSLQVLFDELTVSGPGIDTVNDQTGFDLFTNTATGNATGTFMLEIAGFAPNNRFGVYNSNGDMAELFDGANNEGDGFISMFLDNGNLRVTTESDEDFNDYARAEYQNFGNIFGFYLTNGAGQTFYTENSRNGGYQQAVVYQGDDQTVMDLPGRQAGLFTDNEFIIAFEDLWVGGHTDRDYNDLVVMVESIAPASVPEPTTVFGLGAVAVGLVASRRQSKKNS
ncbi:MAG: DUF4114 domain-containing protein [Limnospira sp.]